MNKYRLTERLKEFINDSHQAEQGKITQRELEKHFKDTPHQRKRQTFSNYLQGKIAVPSDLLYELANMFNVSSDYLLGISEIKTTKEDIKAAAKLTGLSDDAIKTLISLKKDGLTNISEMINILLDNVEDIQNRKIRKPQDMDNKTARAIIVDESYLGQMWKYINASVEDDIKVYSPLNNEQFPLNCVTVEIGGNKYFMMDSDFQNSIIKDCEKSMEYELYTIINKREKERL